MSSLNSLNRSVLRLSGLNSGLETDTIVKQMLQGSQFKVDRQFRTQTTLQWKQDKHIDINNMLRKLKDEFSTVLKQEQNMLSEYNYRKYNIRMSNEGDNAYLSATAEPYANAGSLTVDYVKQLATAARYESSGNITGTAGGGINVTNNLMTIHNQMVMAGGAGFNFGQNGSLKFELDGESFEFNAYTTTMDSLISTVNARCQNITMSYSQLADQFTISSRTTGASSSIGNIFSGAGATSFLGALKIYGEPNDKGISTGRVTGSAGSDTSPGMDVTESLKNISELLAATGNKAFNFSSDGKLRFSLGGQDFAFEPTDTMEDLMNEVNARLPDLDIRYAAGADKFIFTGSVINRLDFSALDSDTLSFLSSLKISDPLPSSFKEGQNAILSINGHVIESKNNNFTMDGINFSLKRTFNETGAQQGKNITLTVDRDVQSSVDMIKKYIEAYNDLLGKLYGLLGEKRAKDDTTKAYYQPLTDAEKAEMTEKQIEEWETLAKQGIMRNDGALSSLVSQMRQSFVLKANGSSRLLSEIGISGMNWLTSSNLADAKMGKIEVNEATLRQALLDNPDEVFKMFTAESPSGNVDEMGLTRRLNALMDNYIKYNEDVTQYYNKQQITQAQNRYNELIDKLYKEEDRLWKKFSTLETLMSNLNAQSSWLSQQISGYSS